MADQFMQLMTGRRQLDELDGGGDDGPGICTGDRGCCCAVGKIGGGITVLGVHDADDKLCMGEGYCYWTVVAVVIVGIGVYFCWKRNNNNGQSGVVASMADELL